MNRISPVNPTTYKDKSTTFKGYNPYVNKNPLEEMFLFTKRNKVQVDEFKFLDIIPPQGKGSRRRGDSLLTLVEDTIKNVVKGALSSGRKAFGKNTNKNF